MEAKRKAKSSCFVRSFVGVLVIAAVGLCYLGQSDWVVGDEVTSAERELYALNIRGPNRVGANGCCGFRAIADYDDRTSSEVTCSAIWSVEPNTYGSIDEYGVLRTEDVNETQEITVMVEYTEGGVTMRAERTVVVQEWRTNGLYVPRDYPTIQAAIDAASDGDIVVILSGRYKGDGNRDIDFKGKAISVRGTDPWDPNVVAGTIIDCNGSEVKQHRGFWFQGGEDLNSVLAGVTITNGYVRGLWYPGNGGGVFCSNSSPTIANCTTMSNSAVFGGGISCIQESEAMIINCTVNSNLAELGGGVLCHESSAMITGCTISGNSAVGGTDELANRGGGIWLLGKSSHLPWSQLINCAINDNLASSGGGIYCWEGSEPVIDGCVISGNKVQEDLHIIPNEENGGGAIFGCDGPIRNCTISENISEGEHGGGGLMFCDGLISKCTISYNSATGGTFGFGWGGGLYECGGAITDCNISYNVADEDGGGLSECDGTISNCFVRANYSWGSGGGLASCNGAVSNCIISGNRTYRHGGGALFSCEGPITNCTVVGNCCDRGYEGGLSSCSGQISNCIVWGNLAWHDTQQLSGCSEPNYSCIQGWTGGGVGNIDIDPSFIDGGSGYWHDNNTPDYTRDDFWVWTDGDYRLLEGSPCIDSGDPNYVAGPGEVDLDGKARVADGDGDGEAVIDMGAYEAEPPAIEVEVKFTPQALNCQSKGKWVKAHFVLAEGYLPEDVDVNSPMGAEPVGVESEWIEVVDEGYGNYGIVAAFDRAGFCEALGGDAERELVVTVEGAFTDGVEFYGTDTIKLKSDKWRHRRVKRLR